MWNTIKTIIANFVLLFFIIALLLVWMICSNAEAPAPKPAQLPAQGVAQPAPVFGDTLNIDLSKLTSSILVIGDLYLTQYNPTYSWQFMATGRIQESNFYAQAQYETDGSAGTLAGIYQKEFNGVTFMANVCYDTLLQPITSDTGGQELAKEMARISAGVQINAPSYVWEFDYYYPVTGPQYTSFGDGIIVTTPLSGVSGMVGAKFSAFDHAHMLYVQPEYFNSTPSGRVGYWFWLTDNVFLNLYYGNVVTSVGVPYLGSFGISIGFDGGVGTPMAKFNTPLLYRTDDFQYSIQIHNYK